METLHSVFRSIASTVFHLGGPGLFIVGVVDSSFLMAPLANDLLVVALSASFHSRFLYYAVMAAAGSTAGCYIVDLVSRKAESGVERRLPSRKLKFVESQMSKHASWALALASIIPPPFPFTPFVVAAAASGYPRKKLLGVVGGFRFARFAGEGLLGVLYGRRILALADSPAVKYTVFALIVVALGGSAFSIYEWARRARSSA